MIDQDQKIDTRWFSQIEMVMGPNFNIKIYNHPQFEIDLVKECSSRKLVDETFRYYLTLDNEKYLLTADQQIIEFENQFPIFPYSREKCLVSAITRINELEQQNLILLSHMEAIMTCLRMRGITDDNLDFNLPK